MLGPPRLKKAYRAEHHSSLFPYFIPLSCLFYYVFLFVSIFYSFFLSLVSIFYTFFFVSCYYIIFCLLFLYFIRLFFCLLFLYSIPPKAMEGGRISVFYFLIFYFIVSIFHSSKLKEVKTNKERRRSFWKQIEKQKCNCEAGERKCCTQRNIFRILLNQTKFERWLHFSN